MRIFIGNLPFRATEEELRELFAQLGEVESLEIITDRETGRSRGFGFIEMEEEGGKKAIEQLNGTEFEGRNLSVNEARPRPDRGNFGRDRR